MYFTLNQNDDEGFFYIKKSAQVGLVRNRRRGFRLTIRRCVLLNKEEGLHKSDGGPTGQ